MNLLSQAAFARQIGVDRSHVTRLKQAGRLVMEGKRVDVEKSMALIDATRNERRADAAPEPDNPAPSTDELNKARMDKVVAEARRMVAQADQEEMARDQLAGSLLLREDVDYVLADFGASLRARMENLASRLAPIVYPLSTLEDTHAAIAEEAESVLSDISEMMERRSREIERQ